MDFGVFYDVINVLNFPHFWEIISQWMKLFIISLFLLFKFVISSCDITLNIRPKTIVYSLDTLFFYLRA